MKLPTRETENAWIIEFDLESQPHSRQTKIPMRKGNKRRIEYLSNGDSGAYSAHVGNVASKPKMNPNITPDRTDPI